MSEPLVLGIFLKVETRGWTGPAPKLPKDPVRIEAGQDASKLFIYDLSPKEQDLTVSDACQRLASRLERVLVRERPAFPEGQYAVRMRLEVGLIADPAQPISYTWPLDFLQALADSEVELTVSHYLPSSDEDDEDDEEY
jgi:hypothetical protein